MAKERVRLVCLYVHDLEWVMRLNAKYASMVRSSLAVPVHRHLMREATEDAWTLQVAERSLLNVVDPGAKPQPAARPAAARVPAPGVAATSDADRRIVEGVSYIGTNSHDAAFETRMSEQPWNQASKEARETGVCTAMAEALLARSRDRGRDMRPIVKMLERRSRTEISMNQQHRPEAVIVRHGLIETEADAKAPYERTMAQVRTIWRLTTPGGCMVTKPYAWTRPARYRCSFPAQ